ncbi:MAG: TonB-dependent receptor [Draconibacterium sp.]|nr:MAG: TonB-dependent receptor [Draconibacterium sp.]
MRRILITIITVLTLSIISHAQPNYYVSAQGVNDSYSGLSFNETRHPIQKVAGGLRAYAQGCILKGVVRDAQNNESVPFATIKVLESKQVVACDAEGNFSINNLEPGYVVLEVSSVGYKTQQSYEILVSKSQIAFVEIDLEPQINILKDVEVRPSTFIKREETPVSMQSIGIKEIESNPGSNRDISRVIQSFPGVGSTPAFRNDIIIRGGGPSENRFFLDDVEIPVLNHFATQGASGGPVGIINADFIRNVDFYSSAFPAAKYNALSGVLDFKQKDGNKDRTNLQFAVGASEASFTADGPLGKKTTYVFSVRRSYLQFLFSAIGLPFLPTFNDYQFKTKIRFSKRNQLNIVSIGSLDFMKINKGLKDPDPSQQAILNSIPVNNQWSYTIGGVYKHFFKKGYHALVASRNMLNNELYKYPENDERKDRSFDYTSAETENKLRYEYHLLHNDFKYVLSANLESGNYSNSTNQKLLISDQVVDLEYNSTLNLLKYGLSGQVTHRFLNKRLLTSLGVRLDASNYNKQTSNLLDQFSPRLSVSYDIAPKLKLNAAAGRYFQQAAYTTMGFRNKQDELVNKNHVKFIGLNQYNIGVEKFIGNNVMVSVEGFYKDYFNYPIDINTGSSLANQGANYFVFGSTEVDFTGKGEAYGVELLNRINLKTFTLLASYTFFRSQFTNINGKYVASAWDSKHLLSITASKKLGNNWQIGAKWRYVGGLPYTPYDLEKSSSIAIWSVNQGPAPDYNLLNAERNDAFHQLDLRIDKNFFFDKWTLMVYFDVQNAYNYKGSTQDIITRKKNSDGSLVTINNGQNYVLEVNNQKQGIVLPAIGIMVKL